MKTTGKTKHRNGVVKGWRKRVIKMFFQTRVQTWRTKSIVAASRAIFSRQTHVQRSVAFVDPDLDTIAKERRNMQSVIADGQLPQRPAAATIIWTHHHLKTMTPVTDQ